jgi:hypothetical protein
VAAREGKERMNIRRRRTVVVAALRAPSVPRGHLESPRGGVLWLVVCGPALPRRQRRLLNDDAAVPASQGRHLRIGLHFDAAAAAFAHPAEREGKCPKRFFTPPF